MKKILTAIILVASQPGCGTTIYRNGIPVLRTYGDSRDISFKDGKTEFHAARLGHPNPIIELVKTIRSAVNSALVGAASGGIL